ncbi:MAG: methyltransferase domain-containing protein [Planctomycetes bacterium]|nr:methyltransferase domain-containing protein [Planctomycetota bacterium]
MRSDGLREVLAMGCFMVAPLGCGVHEPLAERPDGSAQPASTVAAAASSLAMGQGREGPSPGASELKPPSSGAEGPGKAAVAVDAKRPRREVVEAMLVLASVCGDDRVHVLGCGDGAVAIAAAQKHGAKVAVTDADPGAISLARENVRKAGVEGLVELRVEDPVAARIGDAQVLFILLPPSQGKKIERRLLTDLMPGTRVVSWVSAVTALGEENDESGTLYVYKVPGRTHPDSLAPYVQTPPAVVSRMLDLARIRPGDVLYDLGCGDGRIVVEAAKRFGVRAVGIDFDARRIEEARERARREGVERLVELRQEDLLKSDISEATVVTMYLLPDTNKLLRPKLSTLKPGSRIVSHQFPMEGWTPTRTETLSVPEGGIHTLYLWEIQAPRER